MLWVIKYFKKTFSGNVRFFLLVSILTLVIFMTQFNYWFGDYNRSDLNSMKEEIAQISIENEELLLENKLLEEERDKLSSGFLGINSFTASLTQSAGVPEQLYSKRSNVLGVTLEQWSVEFIVIAWPVPDWGLSGATTITSPISDMISIRHLIPGALIPSSFVTKIRGFSIVLVMRNNLVKI